LQHGKACVLQDGGWSADTPMVIESDCLNLVSRVQDSGNDRSGASALIMDIKDAMRSRQECAILKTNRKQNAHKLAHYALHSNSSKASFSFVPSCIQDLVYGDQLRCQSRDKGGLGHKKKSDALFF
jgi:hypothetical protein